MVRRSKNSSGELWMERVFRGLVYGLPLALMFGYYPVISLGSSESMNLELSVPLIWLVVLDVVGVVLMVWKGLLIRNLKGKWAWLLLPAFLSLTVLWSLNPVRGVLTVGILWLIYLAGYSIWSLREVFDAGFGGKFGKWFWGSALVVCGWCVVQCVLDLVGVPREYTLLCEGCTYESFGFPHPNGLAIEPQFMGNLLLAPAIMAAFLAIVGPVGMFRSGPRPAGPSPRAAGANSRAAALRNAPSLKHGRHPLLPVAFLQKHGRHPLLPKSRMSLLIIFGIITTTLFLTFSRGAIYAFLIGMGVMTVACCSKRLMRDGKPSDGGLRAGRLRAVGAVWLTVGLAFVFALNAQGIMAAVSPTNDTYQTGVAKVLNHLSLGVIDVRGETEDVGVVENGGDETAEVKEAAFDGYVAESTDTRLKLSGAAMEVWSKDLMTMMWGVGLGGAGQALYNNGLTQTPKEIVQNQYASLLLETGIVGVLLLGVTVILVVKSVIRNKEMRVGVLALMVAYGVSLGFFSGLTNALQIYLLPMMFML